MGALLLIVTTSVAAFGALGNGLMCGVMNLLDITLQGGLISLCAVLGSSMNLLDITLQGGITSLCTVLGGSMNLLAITLNTVTPAAYLSLAVGALLLCVSAFVSASETAFFSLSPSDKEMLESSQQRRDVCIRTLLQQPQRLLATILITNNFVNIVITLAFAYATSAFFDFGGSEVVEFLVETVIITFLLLLFGEITPKVLASTNPLRMARFTCMGLQVLSKVLYPFALALMKSTSIVEHRMEKHSHGNISMEELSQAVELTEVDTEAEKDILEGITKFGTRQVSDIMHPRMDIVDVDIKADYKQLLDIIISSGYSRIPVYAGTNDKIKGVIYSKDMIPYLDKPKTFRWQALIRPVYIVPMSKHLDDLLAEFQEHKVHLAIVVDEYGGTAGLVTLEDVLEEIVGEISDEYDEEEKQYTQIDENTYLFEGKTLLNDFYKITDTDEGAFDRVSTEVETLAGLVLELRGDFPQQGEKISYENYDFDVVAVDNRRIKTIKVTIHHEPKE